MLAASSVRRVADARLWKARATTFFALANNLTGLAAIVMTEAFAAGETDAGKALEVLESMKLLLTSARPEPTGIPSTTIMTRVYHEKRAFFLKKLGRLDEAITSYEAALAFTESDPRGRLKVRGGIGLVLAAKGDLVRAEQITREVATAAESGGYRQVAETAHHNLEVRFAEARPYEVE